MPNKGYWWGEDRKGSFKKIVEDLKSLHEEKTH